MKPNVVAFSSDVKAADDEQRLIDAAQKGEVEAFARLYQRYRSALLGLCLARLKDPGLAEDAVQETFLKAFVSLPGFEAGKFWSWLATIAVRQCIDIQRYRARSYVVENPEAERKPQRLAADTTLDEVIATEDRIDLQSALAALAPRQRRALLLYAVEGWSYSAIASAEKISTSAVNSLLVRARRAIRAACDAGPFSVFVPVFHRLRWKAQRWVDKVQAMLFPPLGEGLASYGVQVAAAGALAIAIITVSGARSTESSNPPTAGSNVVALASQQKGAIAGFSSPVARPTGTSNSDSPIPPVIQSFTDDVLDPSRNASPDNTKISSMVVSPNYERDHTIFSAGECLKITCRPVFVSRDGGGSWKRLPAGFFLGPTLLLPPSYPADPRIFSVGKVGSGPMSLQESIDGGESFKVVGPPAMVAALSPAFGKGDARFLLGYKSVVDYFDYRADQLLAKPIPLGIPASLDGYSSIAFSPAYPADPVIFVGTPDHPVRPESFKRQPLFYRCDGPLCSEVELEARDDPILRLSPRFHLDGLAYAFTYGDVLTSVDGARSFQRIQSPVRSFINELAINWDSDPPVLFAAVHGATTLDSIVFRSIGGIYRSMDGGRSWDRSSIGISGFEWGASQVILTPTGRLLASGTNTGIACSLDGGQTWDRRCPPES